MHISEGFPNAPLNAVKQRAAQAAAAAKAKAGTVKTAAEANRHVAAGMKGAGKASHTQRI